MDTMETTNQKNNILFDDEIVTKWDTDGYPWTIFGKAYAHNGYCYIKDKGAHLYIYEYFNGKIPKDCEIHHINKNKKDNRIENLKLLIKKEHREIHNRGIFNPCSRNKKSNFPYGFSYSDKLSSGRRTIIFQYFDNNGVRRKITNTRIDILINRAIEILQNLDKNYTYEINNIKNWAQQTDIDLLTFEKLEKNGLPKGCILHKRTNGKSRYEFIHPSGNFLGGSVDFNKALEKAIKNTTDSLYKSYLIKKWQKM